MMKKSSKQLNYFITIVLSIILAGCSWFGESAEPENASYEAGKKALSEGKFEEAKSHLRDITPDSPFYPQAVWMIQKVPFKKGVSAYEQKQFQVAISEFSKVPQHSPDYAEAQNYLNLINYKILHDQLQEPSKKNNIVLISDLVKLAGQLGDAQKVLESFDLVKSGIKQSSSSRQTEDFLMLLGKIVSRNKDQEIHEKALNFLLTDFEQLYKQSEIRPQVFQIIGSLKMELM